MLMNTSSQGEISSHCAASLYETKSLNIELLHFFIQRRKLKCDQEYSDTTDQEKVSGQTVDTLEELNLQLVWEKLEIPLKHCFYISFVSF